MQYSDGMIERVAGIFQSLSETMRLKIMLNLKSGEKCVTELIALTGAQQANVSKHLGILKRFGMVKARRKGLNIYYSISDKRFLGICDSVCEYLAKRHEEEGGLFQEEEKEKK